MSGNFDHDDQRTARLLPALHEEIDRLPRKYRFPLILCRLVGRTHAQAAKDLRWPVEAVRIREAAALEAIRGRLERRGFGLSIDSIATSLTEHILSSTVPPELVGAVVRAASKGRRGPGGPRGP